MTVHVSKKIFILKSEVSNFMYNLNKRFLQFTQTFF